MSVETKLLMQQYENYSWFRQKGISWTSKDVHNDKGDVPLSNFKNKWSVKTTENIDLEYTYSKKCGIFSEIFNIKDFYSGLCSSNSQPHTEVNAIMWAALISSAEEIKRALNGVKIGKCQSGISVDLIKDSGETAVVKVANLLNKCFNDSKPPKDC